MNQPEAYLDILVEDLNISNALARRLCRGGVLTLGQLLTMSDDDLRRMYWIGAKSIAEIQHAIRELGLEPLGVHAPRPTIRRIT